jgi:hypothetical protein
MEMVRILIDNQPLSGKKASVPGEFRLDHMPTGEEAKAIRKVLQLREKRVLSEDQKKTLAVRFALARARKNR